MTVTIIKHPITGAMYYRPGEWTDPRFSIFINRLGWIPLRDDIISPDMPQFRGQWIIADWDWLVGLPTHEEVFA